MSQTAGQTNAFTRSQAALTFATTCVTTAPPTGKSPFVHKFRAERGHYVYDVNTSRILRTSPVVWDVVEDHGRLATAEVQSKFVGRHESREIAAALTCIDTAQREKGLLLSVRPTRIESPYSDEEIGRRLATRRGQLILNVTEDCNFRCSYCVFGGRYPNRRTHSVRYMPLHVAHAAVDDYLAHSREVTQPVVSFYGGEPLLAVAIIKDVVEYVRKLAGSKRVLFSLTTNGSLLTGDTAKFLAREGFSILVSLDGPGHVHDCHRRTRTGRPTWAIVTENVRTFLARCPEYRSNGKMGFSAVIAPGTDLRDVRDFFGGCDLCTGEMHLNLATPTEVGGSRFRDSSSPDTARPGLEAITVEFFNRLQCGAYGEVSRSPAYWVHSRTLEEPLVRFHHRKYVSPHLPMTYRFSSTCLPGERRVFVTVDGDYFPCEQIPPADSVKIGDVRRGLDAARISEMVHQWVAASRDECLACWCLPICGAACFANAQNGAGDVTPASKRSACTAYRQQMHSVLVAYSGVLAANPKAFDYSREAAFV